MKRASLNEKVLSVERHLDGRYKFAFARTLLLESAQLPFNARGHTGRAVRRLLRASSPLRLFMNKQWV